MLFIFLIFLYFLYNPFTSGGSISAIWPAKLIRNLCSPLCTPCAASPQMGRRFPKSQASSGSHPGSCFHHTRGCFHSPALTPGNRLPSFPNPHYIYHQKLVICLILEGMFWLPFSPVLLLLAGCPPFCLHLYIALSKLSTSFFPLHVRSHAQSATSLLFTSEGVPFCCPDIFVHPCHLSIHSGDQTHGMVWVGRDH